MEDHVKLKTVKSTPAIRTDRPASLLHMALRFSNALSISLLFGLGANLLAKVRKDRRKSAADASPPCCTISARSRKRSARCPLPMIAHFLALGLTPWQKVADLLPTQIYHPVKFHRPAPFHAGDIRYKVGLSCEQTNKQTVNDTNNRLLINAIKMLVDL